MNILLAYNDTDVSNRALERAAELVKLYGAKLVVTSVTPATASSLPRLRIMLLASSYGHPRR